MTVMNPIPPPLPAAHRKEQTVWRQRRRKPEATNAIEAIQFRTVVGVEWQSEEMVPVSS
jgi:hypothetical protein